MAKKRYNIPAYTGHKLLPPREVEFQNFAWALMRLIDGSLVQRGFWDRSWVGLWEPDEKSPLQHPFLYRRYAGATVAHWTPTDEDLLAVDWCDLERWGPE